MKRMLKVLVAGLVLGATACGQQSDGATIRQALENELAGASISLGDAACAALAHAGEGAVLVEAEFEIDDDGDDDAAGYEVELLVDGAELELYVDPQIGEVTAETDDEEEEVDDAEEAEDAPSISLDCDGIKAAIAAAESETGGKAFELEIEEEIEVGVVSDAQVTEVELDSELNVLSTEVDDDWGGDSDDEEEEDSADDL